MWKATTRGAVTDGGWFSVADVTTETTHGLSLPTSTKTAKAQTFRVAAGGTRHAPTLHAKLQHPGIHERTGRDNPAGVRLAYQGHRSPTGTTKELKHDKKPIKK